MLQISEICMAMGLAIHPSRLSDLFTLSKTTKMHHRIYNSDLFWKMYYQLYVNPAYVFKSKAPEGIREHPWRKRFFRDYSQIEKFDCTISTTDMLWTVSMRGESTNYMTIDRMEDGSVVGIPVIPLRYFSDHIDHIEDGTLSRKEYKTIFLDRTRRNDQYKYITVASQETSSGSDGRPVRELVLVTYPFHHRAVVNFKSWKYHENFLNSSRERLSGDQLSEKSEYSKFEYSKRHKAVILSNGVGSISAYTGTLYYDFPLKGVFILPLRGLYLLGVRIQTIA